MDISAQIIGLGLDPDSLLAELKAEQTRRIVENRLKHYKPYPKQAEFHAMGLHKRERLFMAANQCLTPNAYLQTDRGERRIADMLFGEGFGVRAWDGGELNNAQALPVFLKGIEPAFRLHLDNREVLECSRKHRLLTSAGWLSLAQIVLRADGLRLWNRARDCQASCGADGHLCDQPLRPVPNSDLAEPPSEGDAQPYIRSFARGDARAQTASHSHAYRLSALPPISESVLSPLADLCANPLFDTSESRALLSSGDIRALWRYRAALAPAQPAGEEWLLELTDCAVFAASWPRLIGRAQIVAVEPIGLQPILDFAVPTFHNYEASGTISHNSGKTLAGSAEGAIHLTGRYPQDWQGRRFNRAITAYAGSVTRETTRDGLQRLLLGRVGALGTGMIPKDAILSTMSAQGVADAIAIARIKNEFGPPSTLIFKSYDMGREKWQADTLDLVMFDEEPPLDIYTEGLTRTNTVADAMVWLTFTPLLGMSDVVRRFLMEENPDRGVVTMTIDDALHYTPEQRQKIIDSYPEHEREARTKGIPTMGSGRVYPVLEDMIAEEGQRIPDYWARIIGLDFGWDHPTAAVWLAWDRDADVVHIYDVYRVRQQTPVIHGAAIRARGAKIPVAWPHDGLQHDKGSGEQLAELYRKQGVAMLPERAQFSDDRGNGVEAGCMEILDRMQTGRLKVAKHLADWWEEFRLYHRDEGKIVKEHDDVMDAMRVAIMSLRFAKAQGARPTDKYRRSPAAPQSAWAA